MHINPLMRAWLLQLTFWALLCLVPLSSAVAAEPVNPPKVVYHIDSREQAIPAIRHINNQRKTMPDVHIVVIALGDGVRFLLEDAKDDRGNSYSALIDTLMLEGVAFKVCLNTLDAEGIDPDEIAFGVGSVRSGIAEITRLQWQFNYAYIKP